MRVAFLLLFVSLVFAQQKFWLAPMQLKPSSCEYSCGTYGSDYFGRVYDIDLNRGLTRCYVYDKKTPHRAIATDEVYNKFCQDQYRSQIQTNYSRIKLAKTSNLKQSYATELDTFDEKYFAKEHSSDSKEFLTTSRAMLAGVTLDGGKIDLKGSLALDSLKISDEYTLYQNDDSSAQSSFAARSQEIALDVVKQKYGEDSVLSKELFPEDSTIDTTVAEVFLTMPVMVIDFFSKNSQNYQRFLFVFLLFAFLFGIVYFVFSSNRSKPIPLIIGVVALILLTYKDFDVTPIDTNPDQELVITQSLLQNITQIAFDYGVKFADYTTEALSVAFVKLKLKELEWSDRALLEKPLKQKVISDQQYTTAKELLQVCYRTYEHQELAALSEHLYGEGVRFPADEYHLDSRIDFYTNYLTKDLTTHDLLSVSACHNLEKIVSSAKQDEWDKRFESAFSTLKSESTTKLILKIVESAYKDSSTLGFLYAPLLPLVELSLKNVSVSQSDDKKPVQESVLENLSYFVMMGSGLVMVCYWLVLLVLYFVTIPFWIIYAFYSAHLGVIKSLLSHGVKILLLPSLIVLAIFIAVVVTPVFDIFGSEYVYHYLKLIFGLDENAEFYIEEVGFFVDATKTIFMVIKPVMQGVIILFTPTILYRIFGRVYRRIG